MKPFIAALCLALSTTAFAAPQEQTFEQLQADPALPGFVVKKFFELDHYTSVSDGNNKASQDELKEYLKQQATATLVAAAAEWNLMQTCGTSLGHDSIGTVLFPADCFRAEFFGKLDTYLQVLPNFQTFWHSLDAATQAKAARWMEQAGRVNGKSENPVGGIDLQGIVSQLYFAETLFTRFNSAGTGNLTKQDLKTMFPLFSTTLTLAFPQSGTATTTYILEGAFSYLFRFHQVPVTTTVGGAAQFGMWLVSYNLPATQVSGDRKDLLLLQCVLANPQAAFTAHSCD